MTLNRYKGYTIRTVGISHYIYRPGTSLPTTQYPPGYAQSMAAAKRWVNADIKSAGQTPDAGSADYLYSLAEVKET